MYFINNVTIHIFTMDCPETGHKALSKTQISQLKKECLTIHEQFEIKIYNVRECFEKHLLSSCNLNSFYTPYTGLRLIAPYVLTCDKVLYIDCDFIVLKSLKPIYSQICSKGSILVTKLKDDIYFATATYLHDLKKERYNHYRDIEKAIHYYNTIPHKYPDLNALNIAFKDSDHLVTGNLYTYNPESSIMFHISSKEINEIMEFLNNSIFPKKVDELRKLIIKIVQFINTVQFKIDDNWGKDVLM